MDRENRLSLADALLLIAILIVVVIAMIPNYFVERSAADEVSAVRSLHTIHEAEDAYQDRYPSAGFACTLAALGPPPKSVPPSSQAADLIDSALSGGFNRGYVFTITGCDPKNHRYNIAATPQSSGRRRFCSDQSGVIRYSNDGGVGASCSQEI